MQIRIDLKICIILLIFLVTKKADLYLVFMLFAILHELGHLITGLILGFRPKSFSLMPMGLSICFKVNKKIKNAKYITLKKLLISFAGPLTNFTIAFLIAISSFEFLNVAKETIIYANILIGFFNLIPIYPLDGGRIVKYIIHMQKNLRKSYKYTNLISNITLIIITAVSSIAILYLKNIAIVLIVMYLWILVIKENNIYNKKMHLYKLVDNIEQNAIK